MRKEIEILSPAGSYESLKAAIAAGADAVYVGGSHFGARAFADNFTEEELLEAIDYVHLCGRRIYLTINTLLKENELSEVLYDYLLPYYKQGIDAVIVQDMGVLQFVKKHFPDLSIHASTQMTITNLLGVRLLEKLGVDRVVTARELQLDEIREIADNTDLEIESFVHGALCYSYSGQCLYSSLLGGRSGNRGQCAQPCRLPYRAGKEPRERYVLSLKDICTLDDIPELIESGIYSFKIEGRMKKPEYVALVTAMYRKYVDLYFANGRQSYQVSEEDKLSLMDLYNRGGFHGGYYKTRNGRDMVSITRPNHAGVESLRVEKSNGRNITVHTLTDISKGDVIELPNPKENYTFAHPVSKGETITLLSHKRQNLSNAPILYRVRNERLIEEIHKNIIGQCVKTKIKGKIFLCEDKPALLLVDDGLHHIEVTGGVCEKAVNQPTDRTRIETQLRKTGNTMFEFEKINIQMDSGVFVPMQVLNELRRNALEQLEQIILAGYRRKISGNYVKEEYLRESKRRTETFVYVLVREKEQFQVVCDSDIVKRIYLDCNLISNIWQSDEYKDYITMAHRAKKEIYLAMPHVFRKTTRDRYHASWEAFQESWDGMLIRNYEEYEFLKEHSYKKKIVTDHHLYVFNRMAEAFWKEQGVEATTAPLELNERELHLLDLSNSELMIYGYQPMMVSVQCVLCTTQGCGRRPMRLSIEDRYHKKFSVCNYCDYCYNVIYNTLPLVLFDQMEQVKRLALKAVRLEFVSEDAEQTQKVLEFYQAAREPEFAFTRGHFKRGIK